MSVSSHDSLKKILERRESEGRLRSLPLVSGGIDFSSNDYLGFAAGSLHGICIHGKSGSTGSRLLSGNSAMAMELEKYIAEFHHAESGLIFNSGYDANLGLLSCIAGKHDTILYDELSHASIHDGIRLSLAKSWKFRHNDIHDLHEKLKRAEGNIYVVTESVFSMDGDEPDLKNISALCNEFDAALIVDEAHGTGVLGPVGKGKVVEDDLQNKVFARIHTFGKALGTHGAIVLGSKLLKKYLINYARSFIYTTALPEHSLLSIREAYSILGRSSDTISKLHDLIQEFREQMQRIPGLRLSESRSPVQVILVGGNSETHKAASILQEKGFDIRAILSPTVPSGTERLRICLHAFNTISQINDLATAISEIPELVKPIAQQ